MRSREVVHLTQNQIDERAYELGDTLTTEAENSFLQELKLAKDSSCKPAFDSVSKSMADAYKTEFSRHLFDRAKLKAIASKKEKEVLEAYVYSHEHKIPITPNYQKDGDKAFIFNKALILNQQNCANCHSKQKNPLLQGKLGDTIGIWSIRYSKKMVIMSFVD